MHTSFLAILASAGTSVACTPNPDFVYDDLASQEISIALALVTHVEIEPPDLLCWHIEYGTAQYLYGSGDEEFSVTTCTGEPIQLDTLSSDAEGLEILGFTVGAEVLVGLVQPEVRDSGLRYATPTCWGPLHYNLGNLSSEERAELLEVLRTELEQAP